MVLNELIEKYSLNVVSKHTRIASEYLMALLERDCAKLKRVQAMGFISIIEREYGIDLSSLRKECQDYFEAKTHNESLGVEDAAEISIFAATEDEKPSPSRIAKAKERLKNLNFKSHLNKVAIGLGLIIVAYGSWNMFVPSDDVDTTSTQNVKVEQEKTKPKPEQESKSDEKSDSGFFSSVTSIFGGSKDDKTEKKEEKKEEVKKEEESPLIVGNSLGTQEKKETPKPKPKPKPKDTTQENIEAQIIAKVKQEESQKAEQNMKREEEGEEVPQISDLISSATAGVDEIVDDSKLDEGDTLDTEVPSMSNLDEETPPAPKKKEEKKKEVKKKETTKKGKYKTITFHPRAKVWVGYTNLTTMRRAVATGADNIPLDVSQTSYILATGHGRVEFLNGNKSLLKLSDGKKHFFKISKDGVKEISHEAFQKLNKSKVW
jgi:hypothetical protein